MTRAQQITEEMIEEANKSGLDGELKVYLQQTLMQKAVLRRLDEIEDLVRANMSK